MLNVFLSVPSQGAPATNWELKNYRRKALSCSQPCSEGADSRLTEIAAAGARGAREPCSESSLQGAEALGHGDSPFPGLLVPKQRLWWACFSRQAPLGATGSVEGVLLGTGSSSGCSWG